MGDETNIINQFFKRIAISQPVHDLQIKEGRQARHGLVEINTSGDQIFQHVAQVGLHEVVEEVAVT
jgi:hypothetical protein